jgi:predicted transcriptional regulator YdeE
MILVFVNLPGIFLTAHLSEDCSKDVITMLRKCKYVGPVNHLQSFPMNIAIISQKLTLHIHGFSGTATNKDYAGTAFKLMDKMWQVVKVNNVEHKGLNIWVYEAGEKVFAGVELNGEPAQHTGLEEKIITLTKYAHYKHAGPYNLIKQAGQNMREELQRKGLTTIFPYIEIYGHRTTDESKLETELLMCLQQDIPV